MAIQIYKKIEQSKKRENRSSTITTEELNSITEINERFVLYFKNKHLS